MFSLFPLKSAFVISPVCIFLAHGRYHDINYDPWQRPAPRRSVDVMTDAINDLGVRILQQYVHNGNVAFSPTGIGFIMIALHEGSAGRGSQQIAEAMCLPHDRQILRIGMRDIHRRLRVSSYYLRKNSGLKCRKNVVLYNGVKYRTNEVFALK